MRLRPPPRGTASRADGFVIREALAAAVYEKRNLDDIAAELHMSKSNMIRVFKREYGTTPYEFLLGEKIDAAKLLLKNTRMKVSEIADRVCVADEHYFSALFLKRTGMRPGAYRENGRYLLSGRFPGGHVSF